ncbi:MAG: aminoacyl-tRNA hydrolase [Acidobacteria bacterium]|nr:aminoacyl-tRNA hydrolase [Acidobacteriota bacterium]
MARWSHGAGTRTASRVPVEYAVVGLGNPGARYARSPHNIGFLVVDRLAERESIRMARREARSLVGAGEIAGRRALLAKPQTFMNLSGTAVEALLKKHGLGPDRLVVVYDDHDLPWSAVRIREQGSAGGHHGMESIIGCLGTSQFARVRVGINPGGGRAQAEYLLQSLGHEQRKALAELLDYTAQAVAAIISEGVAKAMTKFNRRARGEPSEEK